MGVCVSFSMCRVIVSTDIGILPDFCAHLASLAVSTSISGLAMWSLCMIGFRSFICHRRASTHVTPACHLTLGHVAFDTEQVLLFRRWELGQVGSRERDLLFGGEEGKANIVWWR